MTNPTPIAWINGRVLPAAEAALSLADMGFVHGAAVAEMLRTFAGKLFRLDDHLARMQHGLDVTGFTPAESFDEIRAAAVEVAAHNAALLDDGDDLGLVIFVTAGLNPTYLGADQLHKCGRATVGVHTFRLPFAFWAQKYANGQHLIVPSRRAVPAVCLDPTVKFRSRLHWVLADREVRAKDPQAAALPLDAGGRITETSSGNVFIVSAGRVAAPPRETTLNGISQKTAAELAAELGLPCEHRPIELEGLLAADEAFTSSTPYCLLPVTQVNGKPIADGRPGPVFSQLISAWSRRVGVDVVAQAVERGSKNDR